MPRKRDQNQKTKKPFISFTIDQQVYQNIVSASEEQHCSISELCRRIITNYLSTYNPQVSIDTNQDFTISLTQYESQNISNFTLVNIYDIKGRIIEKVSIPKTDLHLGQVVMSEEDYTKYLKTKR